MSGGMRDLRHLCGHSQLDFGKWVEPPNCYQAIDVLCSNPEILTTLKIRQAQWARAKKTRTWYSMSENWPKMSTVASLSISCTWRKEGSAYRAMPLNIKTFFEWSPPWNTFPNSFWHIRWHEWDLRHLCPRKAAWCRGTIVGANQGRRLQKIGHSFLRDIHGANYLFWNGVAPSIPCILPLT